MKTIVYRYGLLSPTVLSEEVAEQIRKAHAYQNKLIELERKRREERDKVIAAVPDVAVIDSQIAGLEAELDGERKAVSAGRSEARSKGVGDPTRAQNIREELRKLWPQRKAALKAANADPVIKARLEEINEAAKPVKKAARADCGVYWGTYLLIEQAAEQASKAPAAPRFQRWTGDGAIGIQLIAASGQEHKQAVSGVLSGENNYIRLLLDPRPVPGRGGKPLPRLLIRIDSTEQRAPVFAEFPIVYHRALPEGCFVKGVKVVRRRIGTHDQWSAHFTVAVASADPVAGQALAVNLRWSKDVLNGETTTLAADWHSDSSSGTVHVPPASVSQMRKSDDLRSIRDKNFEREKPRLIEALRPLSLPDDFKERIEHMHAWKAQAKLAWLVIWWRSNRFAGDEAAYLIAEAWRKQDKHLLDWESNARRRGIAHRKDQYRVFAAQMARTHKVLVIEKLRIDRLAAKPAPEEERDFNAKASAQRFATAPSELRSVLLNAFRREGGVVVEVPAGFTSREMLAQHKSKGGEALVAKTGRSERTKRLLKNKRGPSGGADASAPVPASLA